MFTNNTIQLGKSTGIVVQGGSVRFEENHITQHNHAAVLVIGPSSVVFLKNAIQSNNVGVILEAEGLCPIPAATGIDPTTIISLTQETNNTQGKRRQRGVAVAAVKMVQEPKGSTVILDSNIFSANKVAGVQMQRGSAPTIVKNQFSDGDTGVQIFSLAQGVVESNILMSHRICAIEVNGPSIVTKIRLNLFDGNEVGVLIKANTSSVNRRSRPGSARSDRGAGGPPRINILDALGKADVDLDDASLYGDDQSNDSDDSIDSEEQRRQQEEQQKAVGLGLAGLAVVTITKNTFIRNRRHGCYLVENSESNITGNAFQSELCAIGGTSGSSPTVSDNVFSRCVVGVHSGATTNFLIEKNQFVDETEIGVLCNGGTGLVASNVFANCLVAGVCTEGSGCPSVTRNLFAHNSSSPWSAGIYTRKGGSGYFTDNDIHENSIGVRCDNGGLGSITNNFLHDNGYGMFVASNGLCTVATCFFCCNSIADVCSCYGGRPNVSRCVMHDTAKPIMISNYGGGSFTYNILKNVEGAAILISFPLPTDAKVTRTKPKGLHEILVESGDVIARDAVMYLLSLEEVVGRIAMRSIPTFSSNLIAQCSIGIEVDCGAATKHRIKAKETNAPSAAAAAAAAEEKKKLVRPNLHKDYQSPLPNLATLQRAEYWAIITRNLITQCVCGVSVTRGPTANPPRFVPATDVVLEQSVDIAEGGKNSANPKEGGGMDVVAAAAAAAEDKQIMQAEDDVRMTYFEDNTIILNETGVQMKQGGNARFDRNYVTRCTKAGIMILDEGRGEFFENVLVDCPQFAVYVQGDPRGKTASDPSWMNIQECVISHAKVGISVAGGEPRIALNRIYNSETGFNIGPLGVGLMVGNLVHDCKRVGGICYSESLVFRGNTFYSSLELGAFEMKCEGVRLPMGNIVRNQFSPRITKADPAQKVNLLGEQVNEATSAKEQRDLFSTLKDMHAKQLPASELGGCPRMGIAPQAAAVGSLSAAAAEMANSARKKSIAIPESSVVNADSLNAPPPSTTKDQYQPGGGLSSSKSFRQAPKLDDDEHDDIPLPHGGNFSGGGGNVFESKWGSVGVVAFQPSVVSMAGNKSWTTNAVKMGRQEAQAPKPKEVIVMKKKTAAVVPAKVRRIKRAKPQRKSSDDGDSRSQTPQTVATATPPVSQRPSPKQQRPLPIRGTGSSPKEAATGSPTKAGSPTKSGKPSTVERQPEAHHNEEDPQGSSAQAAVDDDLPPLSGLHVVDMQFPATSGRVSSSRSGGSRSGGTSRQGVSPPQRPETAGETAAAGGSRHSSRLSGRQSAHSGAPHADSANVAGSHSFDVSPSEGGGDDDDFGPLGLEGSASYRRSSSRHSSSASMRPPVRSESSGSLVREASGERSASRGSRLSRMSSSGAFESTIGMTETDNMNGDIVLADENDPDRHLAEEDQNKSQLHVPARRVSPVLIRRKRTAPARIMSRRRITSSAGGMASPLDSEGAVATDGQQSAAGQPQPRRRGDRPSLISIVEENEESMSIGRNRGKGLRKIQRSQSESDLPAQSTADEDDEDHHPLDSEPLPPVVVFPKATTYSPSTSTTGTPVSLPLIGHGKPDTTDDTARDLDAMSDDDLHEPEGETALKDERSHSPTMDLLPPSCHEWISEQRRDRKARRRSAVKDGDLSNGEDDDQESTRAVVNQPVTSSSRKTASRLSESRHQAVSPAAYLSKGSLSDEDYVSLIVNHTKRIAIPTSCAGHSPRNSGDGARFTFYRGESPNFHISRMYHNRSASPRSGEEEEKDKVSSDDDVLSITSREEGRPWRSTKKPLQQDKKKVVQIGFAAHEHSRDVKTLVLATTPPPRPVVHPVSSAAVQKDANKGSEGVSLSAKTVSCISLDLGGLSPPPHPRSAVYEQYVQELLRKKGAVVDEARIAGPRQGPHIPIVPSLSELAPQLPPSSTSDGSKHANETALLPVTNDDLSSNIGPRSGHREPLSASNPNQGDSLRRPVSTSMRDLVIVGYAKGHLHFDTSFFPPPNPTITGSHTVTTASQSITTPPPKTLSELPQLVLHSTTVESDADDRSKQPRQLGNMTPRQAGGGVLSPRSPMPQKFVPTSPVTPYSLPVQLPSRPLTGAELRSGRTIGSAAIATQACELPPTRRMSDVRFQQGSKHVIFGDCEVLTRRRQHRSHTVDATVMMAANASRSATPAAGSGPAHVGSTLTVVPGVGQLVKRGAGEALIPFTNLAL